MKIAYLTNIPSPYRVAMMDEWALRLRNDLSMELRTYYTDKNDQGRGWSVANASRVAEERLSTIVSVPGYGRLNWGLLRLVLRNDIVMIGGFEQASYLATAFLARVFRRKVILLFDGFSPRRIGTDALPVRFVKWLTGKLCHVYFANGSVGRNFILQEVGAEEARIFNQYLSVSTRHIDHERSRGIDKQTLRSELNLPKDCRIVAFCGYLIERKRPELLIHAVSALPAADRPVVLMIGRGPLEDSLRQEARRLGVEIVFCGFREGAELARYYLASDFLVLPSDDDPWGLVVNEAMAAGLPVISSDACGATEDMVIDGVTGFAFRAGDARDLRRAIMDLLASDQTTMSDAAFERASYWTTAHSARSLCACVKKALEA